MSPAPAGLALLETLTAPVEPGMLSLVTLVPGVGLVGTGLARQPGAPCTRGAGPLWVYQGPGPPPELCGCCDRADIEEKGVRMKLTVIDTPGFGDHINNENW